MSSEKLLQQTFGVMLVILLLAGCSEAQVGPTATSTSVPPTSTPAPTPTPTLVPPTPTPEQPTLTLGDTFTAGEYEIDLVEVAQWDEITLLTDDRTRTTSPEQSENTWLVVTVELRNEGGAASIGLCDLTSVGALTSSDVSVVDSAGHEYGLSSVGAITPESLFLTVISNQYSGKMIVVVRPSPSRRLFPTVQQGGYRRLAVVPGPLEDGHLVLGNKPVLADPDGPTWYVGLGGPSSGADAVAQFSLLFEVPRDTNDLSWRFLDAPLTRLPQPVAGSPPPPSEEEDSGFSITSYTLTTSDMVGVWADLFPCE